jgi:SAM-dependent methyltransferase
MTTRSTKLAIEHWDKTPLFLTEEQRYSAYPWLYEAAEFRHHPGEKVLEIGCGTGSDLLQFAKNGAEAIGIDATPEHVRLARERVGNKAKVLRADATALPFSDGQFDYVYSHGVLHHIDQPARVVRELFRVLRPGGRFNVQVYAFWSLRHLAYRLLYRRQWKEFVENSRDPVHLDTYTGRQLRALFSPADVTFNKYECFSFLPSPIFGRLLGWFIVARGSVWK